MGKKNIKEIEYLWNDRKRTLFGLPLSFTVYSLSADRLFVQKGLFSTTYDEVRLYRILDLKMTSTLGQKLFGLGTIKVHSADKSMGCFELKNVKNPLYVKELLSDNVEKQREEKRVTNREFMTDFESDDVDDTEEV